MFTKRTIKPHEAVASVDTAAEALAVSISEKACVDMGLSLIHISYQQMQEAAAQAAAPESTMLPDAPEQTLDEYPMPDPMLTLDDLEKCGYRDGDMLPLSKERGSISPSR